MRSSRLALLFALCLALMLGCLLGIRRPADVHEGGSVPVSARAPVSADRPAPDLEISDPPSDEARRPVRPSETATVARIERIESRSSSAATGHLQIRAVDSETGELLAPIRVRAASETRIADRGSHPGVDRVDLALSPDSYSLLVLAQGYEPTELVSLPVCGGENITLEPVRLHAGSARVLGVVTGDLSAEGGCFVELLGEGRRPCARCAPGENDDRCAACGYSSESSILPVVPGCQFAFEGLASGPYAIRLIDEGQRMLAVPCSFDLEAAVSLEVEVEASPLRSVRVELIDTDGSSLAGEWSARIAKTPNAEEVEVIDRSPDWKEAIVIRCQAYVGDYKLAESSLEPPPLDPGSVRFTAMRSISCCGLRGPRNGVDDRHRDRSELLRPPPKPPRIEPDEFLSEVDADGLLRLDSLPSLELTLKMTCGPFAATARIPPADRGERVRIRWKDADCRTCTFREFEKR